MLYALSVIVGLLLFVVIFGVVVAGISVLFEKLTGEDIDVFNVQENDNDLIKMTKTFNTYDRLTNHGKLRNNSYNNLTNNK